MVSIMTPILANWTITNFLIINPMNSIPQSSSFKDEDRRFLDGMFGQGTEYDVFPSIHDLFFRYNTLYFEERLGSVTVEWSSKMTHCAGLCYYHRQTGSCSIKLSELILKFRPVKDLKDTLLVCKIFDFVA